MSRQAEHDPIDTFAPQPYEATLYQPRQTVDPLRGLDAVNDSLIEQYHQLGFLAVADVFSKAQVEQARAAISELIMGREPGFKGLQFEAAAQSRLADMTLAERELAVRKLMGFTAWDERLHALAAHPSLMRLVRRLMGDREPKLFQDMALIKPPGGREKPWHQDKAYFNISVDEPVVGLWIALDDATVENGCMHLIPGSHRDGPVVHFMRRDWQICDTQVRRDQVAVPLKPGGVLIFDGLIHHGTPHNLTDQRRRALQYHYAPSDAVWVNEDNRLAVYGEEGKNVTC